MLNSLLVVWKYDETLSLVFDTLRSAQNNKGITSHPLQHVQTSFGVLPQIT